MKQEKNMEKLLNIAKQKLDLLNVPYNPSFATLPQLMLAVFNEEMPDDLDLNMYDRQDMEQEVISLLMYTDKAVQVMLDLRDKERLEEFTKKLQEANNESQIREVLICDQLYEVMREKLDFFPNNLKLSPAEKIRGEGMR